MAVITEKLLLVIDAKFGGAIKDFDKLEQKVGKTQQAGKGLTGQLEKMGLSAQTAGKLGSVGIAGFAAAGGIAVGVMGKAVAAARDLNEAVNRSRITFGAASKGVEQFSAGAAASLGLSTRAALESASSFGALFQGLKFGQAQSADFARSLTALSADLASAFNTDVTDAAEALRSGLVGEAEPLKRYNIIVNDTIVTQRALDLGLARTTAGVSQQDKAMARLTVIAESSARAMGDFARTSNQLANQQRILAANAENAKASLGAIATPGLGDVAAGINIIATAVNNVGRSASDANGPVAGFIRAIGGGVLGLVGRQFGGAGKDIRTTTDALRVWAEETAKGTPGSERATKALDYLRAAASAAEAAAKGLTAGMQTADQAAAKMAADTAALTAAVIGARQADIGLQTATLAVGDAERNLTAARRDLQRFNRDYDVKLTQDRLALAGSTRAVAEAEDRWAADRRTLAHLQQDLARGAVGELAGQRALRLSTLDLAAAQRSLADAKDRLAKLQAGPDPNDVAEAQLRVEEATNALAAARRAAASGEGDSAENAAAINRAMLDLARAQQEVARLQANSPEQLRAIADAQDEVARQTIAVEQANIDQGTAARDAAEAGTVAAEQLRAAARQVIADQDARTAAVLAENTARQQLSDDEAGRTSALEALRARAAGAEAALATAHLGVASASEAQRAAAEKVNDLVAKTPDALQPVITRLGELGVAWDTAAAKAIASAVAQQAAAEAAAAAASQGPVTAGKGGSNPLNAIGEKAADAWGSFVGALHGIGFRAGGGPVTAGTPYVVGEHRPELFVPNTNGRIMPRLPTGTTGGVEVVEHHSHVYLDGRQVADVVTRHLRDKDSKGGDWRGRR